MLRGKRLRMRRQLIEVGIWFLLITLLLLIGIGFTHRGHYQYRGVGTLAIILDHQANVRIPP